MTLVVAVNSPDTMWLMADRRLTYAGRAPRDDARKITLLDTEDGCAILGYAGLGATSAGTEPSDWMARVLRGRNFTLEQSLATLADAAKRELGRHLSKMTGSPEHHIVACASVNG